MSTNNGSCWAKNKPSRHPDCSIRVGRKPHALRLYIPSSQAASPCTTKHSPAHTPVHRPAPPPPLFPAACNKAPKSQAVLLHRATMQHTPVRHPVPPPPPSPAACAPPWPAGAARSAPPAARRGPCGSLWVMGICGKAECMSSKNKRRGSSERTARRSSRSLRLTASSWAGLCMSREGGSLHQVHRSAQKCIKTWKGMAADCHCAQKRNTQLLGHPARAHKGTTGWPACHITSMLATSLAGCALTQLEQAGVQSLHFLAAVLGQRGVVALQHARLQAVVQHLNSRGSKLGADCIAELSLCSMRLQAVSSTWSGGQ